MDPLANQLQAQQPVTTLDETYPKELINLEEQAITRLQSAVSRGKTVFTTSLSAEDMIIGELIAKNRLPIPMCTLDTGRLFPETLDLISTAEQRWNRKIHVFFPQNHRVEQLVRVYGINGFKEARSTREYCCEVRKLEPLDRALQGAKVWISGLRTAQSEERSTVKAESLDQQRQLVKIAPLIEWSDQQMWAYITALNIPVNPLYQQGFKSIGCAPCTRAVADHEHPRAGRWWWEDDGSQECGLHRSAR
jgi:phosphoadenosine phosphosulfate reductase